MLIVFLLITCTFTQSYFKFCKGTGEIFSTGHVEDPSDFNALNLPIGRSHHSSWYKSSSDHVYIFGGFSSTQDDRSNLFGLNDLWKYSIGNNNYKKLGGCDMTRSGCYNVASTGSYPGSRYGQMYWDDDGEYNMYGGKTNGGTNADHWILDDTTETWSKVGSQGDGKVAVGSTPGSRFSSTIWNTGTDIYLYGGSTYLDGVSDANYGFCDDLWKNVAGTWTEVDQCTELFAKGDFTSFVRPPALYGAVGWFVSGYLYLFGGRGKKHCGEVDESGHLPESAMTYYNNLFYYDISGDTWYIIDGNYDQGPDGNRDIYFGKGENPIQLELGEKPLSEDVNVYSYSGDNWPGARAFASAFVENGLFYLIGGLGEEIYPDDAINGKPYTAIWILNPGTPQWKQYEIPQSFDGSGGSYDTINTYHADNYLGSRYASTSHIYHDGSENKVLIMFGWAADTRNIQYGAYYDTLMAANDELWELVPAHESGSGSGTGGYSGDGISDGSSDEDDCIPDYVSSSGDGSSGDGSSDDDESGDDDNTGGNNQIFGTDLWVVVAVLAGLIAIIGVIIIIVIFCLAKRKKIYENNLKDIIKVQSTQEIGSKSELEEDVKSSQTDY